MGNRIIVSLAIFSERENRSMSSSVRLLSATFVHRTQAIQIFGNVSMPFGTLAAHWHPGKFYGDRPGGTPPSGVAEYSDFGPIERYILETVELY